MLSKVKSVLVAAASPLQDSLDQVRAILSEVPCDLHPLSGDSTIAARLSHDCLLWNFFQIIINDSINDYHSM